MKSPKGGSTSPDRRPRTSSSKFVPIRVTRIFANPHSVFGLIWSYLVLFGLVWSCLVLFGAIWRSLVLKFLDHPGLPNESVNTDICYLRFENEPLQCGACARRFIRGALIR